MKVRHLKKRPRPVASSWIYGGTIKVSKDQVDAIKAWLMSFVRI